MSNTPGVIRFRKWQVGKETTFGTAVAATRVLPYRGIMSANPNWTKDDTDTGSLSPAILDYRVGLDATSQMAGQFNYDDAPYLYAACLKGGVTPTGSLPYTWTFQPASLTQDDFELFTGQWGDDVSTPTNDWVQGLDGVVEQITLTGPDNQGPFGVQANWRFADINGWGNHALSGTVPTAGLTVDTSPERVMLADTELYIDDAYTDIGTTKISDALHTATVTFNQTVDLKRFSNGSNTRFAIRNYSRADRMIDVRLRFAKTSAIVTEAQNVFASDPVKRFIELRTTSPNFVSGSTPYSHSIKLPLQYTTREDTDMNNNSVIDLVGHAYYDTDLGYDVLISIVNALSAL